MLISIALWKCTAHAGVDGIKGPFWTFFGVPSTAHAGVDGMNQIDTAVVLFSRTAHAGVDGIS